MGMAGELPDDYEVFKKMFVDICSRSGLAGTNKFNEEKWSEYLRRLKNEAIWNEIDEKQVFKKLRQTRAPPELQTVFFSTNLSLHEIIEMAEDWEKMNKKQSSTIKNSGKMKYTNTQNNTAKGIKCFKCDRFGHYANECRTKSPQYKPSGNGHKEVNMMNSRVNGEIEEDEVKINNFSYICVFDSGSSINIVSKQLLRNIDKIKIKQLKQPVNIKLIYGTILKINEVVELKIEYKGNRIKDEFCIMDKPISELLIGSQLKKN